MLSAGRIASASSKKQPQQGTGGLHLEDDLRRTPVVVKTDMSPVLRQAWDGTTLRLPGLEGPVVMVDTLDMAFLCRWDCDGPP
jgi:hypothetical protein